jgi:hypothetical protein
MGGVTARCVPAVIETHAAIIAIAKTVLADERVMVSSLMAELWHE